MFILWPSTLPIEIPIRLNAHILSFLFQGGKPLQLLRQGTGVIQRSSETILTSFAHTLISVEHISRVVESRVRKTTILDDLSFTIPGQSLFSINGPSGSGKSTLLNILTGIDRPTSGRVLFEGSELRAKSEDALARWRGKNVGIVFQFFQLIPTLND